MLYLIEILHQTTTVGTREMPFCSCILSKFYIKPQLSCSCLCSTCCCILSKFYIKPQLRRSCLCSTCVVSYRNSTSNHNSTIRMAESPMVVSYRNSTSNHNLDRHLGGKRVLYLIEILHQTTTVRRDEVPPYELYLIEILHQTTTLPHFLLMSLSCILSKFYIKPQRRASY